MFEQMSLNIQFDVEPNENQVVQFSFENKTSEEQRQTLEKKYINLTQTTDRFNRKLVSFQGNKEESIHKWFKYKEGFSTSLVEVLLSDFGLQQEQIILDPFAGSGTTSLTSQKLGYSSVSIDVMEIAKETFEVKKNIFNYDLKELENIYLELKNLEIKKAKHKFQYLNITDGAFPEETENELLFIKEWIEKVVYDKEIKQLLDFALLSILEEISYTRKDGQYLRWDYRSRKVKNANDKRLKQGKEPLKTKLDKGELPSAKTALLSILEIIIGDIKHVQKTNQYRKTSQEFILGSSLFELSKMKSETIDAVVTSPPYCNRYDYTRTYALELNFLGETEESIKTLRQNLLSATVENKSKISDLKEHYLKLGLIERFNYIQKSIDNNKAIQEVIEALKYRAEQGEVNNKGIIRMVEGYFTELTFIYGEIHRLLTTGGKVAIVNDNVRFAGEVIPVDYISCSIAEGFGFRVDRIYCLKQKKGNSSQQMKKYGRVPLRKSITIWEKV